MISEDLLRLRCWPSLLIRGKERVMDIKRQTLKTLIEHFNIIIPITKKLSKKPDGFQSDPFH